MRKRHRWLTGSLALAGALGFTLLGCHAGTPAAPEGSEIPVTYEYLSRDVNTGNFTALVKATVIDKVSDVPQVGVGVYFRVIDGPGVIDNGGPIVTDNRGNAQTILVAAGALGTNTVVIEVSSGPVTAELELNVVSGVSRTNVAPVAEFTLTPAAPSVRSPVTVDMAPSTDSDCPGGDPVSWTVDWGDGTALSRGDFDDTDEATHDYADTLAGTIVTITVEVTDCTGLTDSKVQGPITLS